MVKNNVPFDVAFAWPGDWVAAACVILGRMDGNEFDSNAMTWKERK